MNTNTFTPKELHDRIKRQVQPFPSLLQSAEDERRRARNAHIFVTDPNVDPDCQHCDECGKPKSEHDQVEQHGAAESFSEWLDQRSDSIPSPEAEAEEQRKIAEFPTEDQLHVMAIAYDQCQIDGGE